MTAAAAGLDHTAHRPWPLPAGPWVIRQGWQDVLFAHWSMEPEDVRARVPATLELDTFGGRAWVSLVALWIELTVRCVPWTLHFFELNLRTHVIRHGQPGLYFFSLDASSKAAVLGGRALYRLNYQHAAMATVRGAHFEFNSRRLDRPAARVSGKYRTTGIDLVLQEATLEPWLVERYCLYAVRGTGATFRAQVHHAPWQLQSAEAELDAHELFFAAQLPAPDSPPLLHYAARQDVLTWAPEPL